MKLTDKNGIAEQLGTTPEMVEQLTRKKLIPYVRLGHRTLRFDPDEVAAAIKRLTIKPPMQRAA